MNKILLVAFTFLYYVASYCNFAFLQLDSCSYVASLYKVQLFLYCLLPFFFFTGFHCFSICHVVAYNYHDHDLKPSG